MNCTSCLQPQVDDDDGNEYLVLVPTVPDDAPGEEREVRLGCVFTQLALLTYLLRYLPSIMKALLVKAWGPRSVCFGRIKLLLNLP